ncbi:TIGR03086 family protein, partial [Mycobacterium tuberculosis]
MDPLMAHQRAQDAFAALLANVRADQLGGPT